MKRLLAIALAALMLLWGTALSEIEGEEGGFGFDFDEESYDGEWVSVEPLGFEFCLPDGWKPTEAVNGTVYAATSADGSAGLAIRLEDEGVENLERWGKANLKAYRTEEANFYDTIVVEDERSAVVRFLLGDDQLIAFEFTRESPEALPSVFALRIVGSVCELWDDFEVPEFDGDGEDFDFGEDLD